MLLLLAAWIASTFRICVRRSITFSSVFISRSSLGSGLFASLGGLHVPYDRSHAVDIAAIDLANVLLRYARDSQLSDEDVLQHLNGGVHLPLTVPRFPHGSRLQRSAAYAGLTVLYSTRTSLGRNP